MWFFKDSDIDEGAICCSGRSSGDLEKAKVRIMKLSALMKLMRAKQFCQVKARAAALTVDCFDPQFERKPAIVRKCVWPIAIDYQLAH